MKVVYERTVVDMVAAALRDANHNGLRIEKIVLTEEERKRLAHEMRLAFGVPESAVTERLFGIRIETEKPE